MTEIYIYIYIYIYLQKYETCRMSIINIHIIVPQKSKKRSEVYKPAVKRFTVKKMNKLTIQLVIYFTDEYENVKNM